LSGPPLAPTVAATHPSEPTCLGAMQVPDGGQPIVILADGPTVGGYPKIAAVIGADLDRFAQLALGAPTRFEWVPLGEAARARSTRRARLERQLTEIRAGYRPR
jgi:allophanate hydrolase subunit 2